jgi:hypothetical protein
MIRRIFRNPSLTWIFPTMRGITAGNLPVTNIKFYVKYRNKLSKDSVKNTTAHINSNQLSIQDYQSHEHVSVKNYIFLTQICLCDST